jgi:glucosamine--fructose-6-phosphate aminotransferase (isomerizing)
MCGIIGYTGDRNASDVVLNGLENLEYRGYDSAGVVIQNGDTPEIRKAVGEVSDLSEKHDIFAIDGTTGIGHTRWATHGDVSTANAHPHTCCTGRIALVHNGIVENYEAFKDDLEDHEFTSDTDSEVIAHFLSDQLNSGASLHDAVQAFASQAEGTFAVVAVDTETETLFGFRRGSPLAVGIGDDEQFLGSDVHAFGDYTRDVIFLDDNEFVILTNDEVDIQHLDKGPVDRKPTTVDEEAIGNGKQGYDHYMLKEIHEQPDALYRLTESLQNSQRGAVSDFVELLQEKDKVLFTAAGTSYHATLLGVYYLQKAGIEAQTLISSEFQNYERVDEDTLLVAVSQSGETRDTLDTIQYSTDRGATVASIVNMPHSAIQRESTVSLEIQAGKEVAVAATKTFTNTVLTLLYLAIEAGYDGAIGNVAEQMEQVITGNEDHIKGLAARLTDQDDMYVIGRGPTYPIAREMALKLKEVPYIHAEGMMGGELKHGTLALIEEGTPVFALVPDEDDDIVSNVHEVEARGGDVIQISPYDGDITIPEDRDGFPLYATTIGFLLSYYLGRERGCPIDKPRNLAKTVTVR